MAQSRTTAEGARERAYLSWINSKISNICPGMLLRSLDDEGMRDGTALAELIDAASASRIQIKQACDSDEDKISNIKEILRRLRELNVPVSTVQPEEIVHGNKNTIMRLLLAISASFMPSHIHDVKHEIRDRHAAFGGQRVWHHVTTIGSEATLALQRFFPTTHRAQPFTIHRLVPAARPPLLHVATAPVQPMHQLKGSKVTTSASSVRKIASHIYNRERSVQKENHAKQKELKSCENLVLSEEQQTPIRASKSLNALHGKTFVSKLVIPQLRYVRSFSSINRSLVSSQQRTNATGKSQSNCDGYVNHGFSDTPVFVANQSVQTASPTGQMAKFRSDLANVKSDLIHLQEVLVANSAVESGITQTMSDRTFSGTLADQILKNRHFQWPRNDSTCEDKLSKTSSSSIESLQQLLRVRQEAIDACLVDNAELRQTIGELTASLKQLQMENANLRQRLTGSMGPLPNSSSNGHRTWSFSSDSIPNTPCSPLDTVRLTNFKLVNGQPHSTLS